MSAIVALALAAAVTLAAGLESYGIPKNDDLTAYDFDASVERAYQDVVMEEFDFGVSDEITKTIKIYDAEDNLIDTVELREGDVIEDQETKKLLNKAEYLSSYNQTELYKITD